MTGRALAGSLMRQAESQCQDAEQTRRWAEDAFNACRGYLISDERTV